MPFRLADNLSDRATLAEAVNTLKFETDGQIFGDNTDGAGIARDIEINLNIPLRDKNILVLGAGGAVRGVLDPILRHRPAKIVIANRTVSKAKDLVRVFSTHGKVEAISFDDLKGKHFDIIINGTAASLQGEVPPLPVTIFARGALAYDMMYGDRPTAFMEWAMLHSADKVVDGLGMLVEQAAESYFRLARRTAGDKVGYCRVTERQLTQFRISLGETMSDICASRLIKRMLKSVKRNDSVIKGGTWSVYKFYLLDAQMVPMRRLNGWQRIGLVLSAL